MTDCSPTENTPGFLGGYQLLILLHAVVSVVYSRKTLGMIIQPILTLLICEIKDKIDQKCFLID